VVYYKHWTRIARADDPGECGGDFVAYCRGCDWVDAAPTYYVALRQCQSHAVAVGEKRVSQPAPKAALTKARALHQQEHVA
jgi:hypothetical protein